MYRYIQAAAWCSPARLARAPSWQCSTSEGRGASVVYSCVNEKAPPCALHKHIQTATPCTIPSHSDRFLSFGKKSKFPMPMARNQSQIGASSFVGHVRTAALLMCECDQLVNQSQSDDGWSVQCGIFAEGTRRWNLWGEMKVRVLLLGIVPGYWRNYLPMGRERAVPFISKI